MQDANHPAFLTDAGLMPEAVLTECISRLEIGAPVKGPTIETMARRVDQSTSGTVAMGLYNRLYRPASTMVMHGGAAALRLHVGPYDKLVRKPGDSSLV
jgi:hypothetical protein